MISASTVLLRFTWPRAKVQATIANVMREIILFTMSGFLSIRYCGFDRRPVMLCVDDTSAATRPAMVSPVWIAAKLLTQFLHSKIKPDHPRLSIVERILLFGDASLAVGRQCVRCPEVDAFAFGIEPDPSRSPGVPVYSNRPVRNVARRLEALVNIALGHRV